MFAFINVDFALIAEEIFLKMEPGQWRLMRLRSIASPDTLPI